MKVEAACETIRPELSARLDGEVDAATAAALDEHLRGCAACRRHEDVLRAVRTDLRVSAAEQVPDLTPSILSALTAQRAASATRRRELRAALRTALVAALATAGVWLGSGVPWIERPPDIAGASEIVSEVREAARALQGYRATYSITEKGWHPDVERRELTADVWFEAPESFRIEISDRTRYPSAVWPRNDVSIVATPRRYRLSEPASCPKEALPSCYSPGDRREQTIVARVPFDGATRFPTDVAVPLETIAAARGFDVVGAETIAGRSAIQVRLAYRDAIPLVDAIEAGGSWRPFHPADVVDLWLDRTTWFPLRYRIAAARSPERDQWAMTNGLSDRPGEILLEVHALSFREPDDIGDGVFRVPRSGTVVSERFTPGRAALFDNRFAPTFQAGLQPYRAGRFAGQTVLSFARGLSWIKVTISGATGTESADPSVAEEVSLGPGSFAYYRPAGTASSRSVDLFGARRAIHVESNLPREILLKVSASIDLGGRRIDPGRGTERISAAALPAYVSLPYFLPRGYDPRAADIVASGRSFMIYLRSGEAEYDGGGIRITVTPGAGLTPTSEATLGVTVAGARGRWSVERGELEWVEDGVYRAVAAPSYDLATALRIAGSMR